MVAISTIIAAALASFTIPTSSRPMKDCDWLGCPVEGLEHKFPSLVQQQNGRFDTASIDTTALSPAQIVSSINMLTQKSQALQAPANSITIINGPLIVIGQGPFPQIITGFVDIVSTGTTMIAQLQGTGKIDKSADQDAVYQAFREFVRVHTFLLNILIGKAGLFSTVPFIGQPVAAVLRQDESIIDTLAFGLIDIAGNRSSDLQTEAGNLGGTLNTAISTFDGVAVYNH